MRSTLALVAFAVGSLAVPYKREIITEYDIVYATQIVTVTAGQEPKPSAAHYGHHGHSKPAEVEHTTVTQEAAPAWTPQSTYEVPKVTYTPEPAPKPKKETPKPADSYEPAPTSYQGIVVRQHNLHRANHTVPDLKWSDELASSAQEIAKSCVYAHNTDVGGGGYGQNIAAGVKPEDVGTIITDMFYNGEEPYFSGLYGQDSPDMSDFHLWGHFSQIVWKGTTEVACATQHCPGGLANVGSGVSPYFTVCNYKSPGNYAGEYAANVLKPMGKASVYGS